jgi:DNA modification methylase
LSVLIQANALALPIQANSVQCVVTSPPYWGLRNYNCDGQLGLEATPDLYVASMVQVFREVWRCLKDDGTLWLNLGDSYNSIGGTVGGGKNLEERKATLRGWQDSLKPKDLVGIPWRVAFALQADGWYLRSDIIWSKNNPMPESVTDRPTKAHEYLFLLTKNARYYYNAEAIAEPSSGLTGGGYSLATHSARRETISGGDVGPRIDKDTRNRRSVWTIATQPYPEAHFATFPEKLVEPCIKAGSRPGDLVLDPFCGSGTVGRVARQLNRRFVGTELNRDYLALATRRLSHIQPELLEV